MNMVIAWIRGIGTAGFWAAAIPLGLMVIPIMNNFGAIPRFVLAIIVLGIASARWGTGAAGRRIVTAGAALVLVYAMMSFFLPQTARSIPGRINSLDKRLATGEPARATVVTPAASRPPVETYFRGTREYVFNPSNTKRCLRGWIDDPYFYVFGGDGIITVEDEDAGTTFTWTRDGWEGGRRPRRAANMAFCQAYSGSADSVHVRGRWKNN